MTPMIELHFTPFIGGLRSRSRLMSNHLYEWSSSRLLSASAAELGYFTIGSLWTAGTPEEYPDYEQMTIDVDVKYSTCSVHRAYDLTRRGNPVIPREYYRIPPAIAGGRVVIFRVHGTFDGMIVPCSEIFRFYYLGPSGKLGRAFLDGTYLTRRYEIVSEPNSQWPDAAGNAYIRLGKCIDNDDRVEIARTTFYTPAMHEMERLIPSAIAGGYKNRYPLIVRPPFEGRTQLVVRGKRIRIGRSWVFLVFRIEKCSAPMPFTHLGFNRQNPSDQGRKGRKKGEPAFTHSHREAHQSDDDIAPKLTQSQDPSSKDVPRRIKGVLSRDRYTTPFVDEFVARGPIEHGTGSVIKEIMTAGSLYATGVGSPRSPARAIAFEPGSEPGLSEVIADFKNLLAFLRAEPNLVVESIEDRPFSHGLIPGDRTVPAWFFIDGKYRQFPRRATVASILIARRAFVVIEIDRKPKLPGAVGGEYFRTAFLSPPGRRSISAPDVRGILSYLAHVEGVVKGRNWSGGPYDSWAADGLWHGQPAALRAKALHAALTALP